VRTLASTFLAPIAASMLALYFIYEIVQVEDNEKKLGDFIEFIAGYVFADFATHMLQECKSKFQLQTIEWSYYGQYSGGARFYVVFPVKKGERIMVEIRKNAAIRKRLLKMLREWERAIINRDFDNYRWLLISIFEMRERMDGDTLVRERISGKLPSARS